MYSGKTLLVSIIKEALGGTQFTLTEDVRHVIAYGENLLVFDDCNRDHLYKLLQERLVYFIF